MALNKTRTHPPHTHPYSRVAFTTTTYLHIIQTSTRFTFGDGSPAHPRSPPRLRSPPPPNSRRQPQGTHTLRQNTTRVKSTASKPPHCSQITQTALLSRGATTAVRPPPSFLPPPPPPISPLRPLVAIHNFPPHAHAALAQGGGWKSNPTIGCLVHNNPVNRFFLRFLIFPFPTMC